MRHYHKMIPILALLPCLATATSDRQAGETVSVRVSATLDSLVRDEDTDNDRRITIDDPHISGTSRGDKRFLMRTLDGRPFEVSGTYYLSNLLQELKRSDEAGKDTVQLSEATIFEPPVERISRSIRTLYWAGLTRRVDEAGLRTILQDEKTKTVDGLHYIYVPPTDSLAARYFETVSANHPDRKLRVVRLPAIITADHVRALDGYHGILTLSLVRGEDSTYHGEPFVVPGGRFNEMYGWDSYFITLGLLEDGLVDLARSMVNNHVYEINHYGAVLNANRTYYLTRSQPPFLTSMALAVYERLPRDASAKQWLRGALEAAIREYRNVWMNKDRLTATGLSRYFDSGYGPSPEVEPGHFDAVYAPYAKKSGLTVREFEQRYVASAASPPEKTRVHPGKISAPELDRYFVHDRSMRESGHDTSYRLEGRSADLVTVDLNSLLYKFETDIAVTLKREFGGSMMLKDGTREESEAWSERARKRKELVDRYLWDEKSGMYFDYDIVRKKRTGYVSATTFYPMWASLASGEQAATVIARALPLLEVPGGIVSTTEESRGPITPLRPARQWDYPNGWAPHQMLVWQALLNYGQKAVAERLAYRWLYTITLNSVNYNGTVPEKFDLVYRTHRVFSEYGNVGTTFSYITREGFGWTNASYQIGLGLLSPHHREKLNLLVPPEWIF